MVSGRATVFHFGLINQHWHSPVNMFLDCLGCNGDRKPGEILILCGLQLLVPMWCLCQLSFTERDTDTKDVHHTCECGHGCYKERQSEKTTCTELWAWETRVSLLMSIKESGYNQIIGRMGHCLRLCHHDYVIKVLMPLAGSPKANRFYMMDQIKSGSFGVMSIDSTVTPLSVCNA